MDNDSDHDWTVSFDPGPSQVLTEDELLALLRPYAVSITKATDSRYEAVLSDSLPDEPNMVEVIWKFSCRLTEVLPGAFIAGHLDPED